MDKKEIIEKLKEVLQTLNEGIQGEFDGYEGTDGQADCRLTEASIDLEELIDTLIEELPNE
jgi:hypothetical protein